MTWKDDALILHAVRKDQSPDLLLPGSVYS